MQNHKHYEAAKRAYYWSSFSPEKRAESECQFFDEINAEFDAAGVDEAGKIKFERLFLLSLAAKSRCASSMITGPARFNVEKNRRANERERTVSDELFAYIERVRKAIDKEKNPQNYASHAIRSDDENAIDKLKEKLAKLQKAQEQMKACNKIIKDKKDNKIERLAEILGTEERAKQLLEPDWCGRLGFASFNLTNNNAAIKAAESRIKQLESQGQQETKEFIIAGVKVVQNAELMRLQFFFDGKPAREIIDLMKYFCNEK
jgi:ribosomal protein L14E/L6E/L27E